MRRILILLATHLLTLGLGFGLGIYLLPILIAPDDPPVEQVQAAMKDAAYRTTFRRDLKGSDAVHWAEGKVSVSATQVAFDGKMGPGPDYKVYLVRDFVDNKADFLKIKAQAQRIGEVKTFNRFLVEVPANVDVDDYTTVVVWCERFSQFISAGQYRCAVHAHGRKRRSRPISRVLSWTVIPLGVTSPQRSSNLPGSNAGRAKGSLFGLAPGGVCRAGLLPDSRCALTAPFHPYRPSEEDVGGIFLLHFPSACAAQALPGTLPYGARTFLGTPEGMTRLSGRLRQRIF